MEWFFILGLVVWLSLESYWARQRHIRLLLLEAALNFQAGIMIREVLRLCHDPDHDEYWISEDFLELCRKHGIDLSELETDQVRHPRSNGK